MYPVAQQEPAGPPPPQMCGRCRQSFVGDLTLPQGRHADWWVCSPCRERLFVTKVPASPATTGARS